MRLAAHFLLIYVLCTAFSWADTVKKNDGALLEGKVLDEDGGYLYLDTAGGIINIAKADVLEMNGKPYDAGSRAGAAEKYATGRSVKTEAGGLGLESVLVARVGNGGIGEKEFYWYLVRAGNNNIAGYRDVPAAARKSVLEKAIDDEVLFQGALGLGFHEADITKKNITELYKNDSRIAGVDPSAIKTDEIRAFYNAHPKLFMKPARFNFKMIPLNTVAVDLEKARREPDSVRGWKSTGWLDQGAEMYLPFSDAVSSQIYAMRKGEVREFQDSLGGRYLFWLTDTQASEPIPFERAREKIKHEMIQSQMAANTRAFDRQFQKDSGSVPTIDALFTEALNAGKHRERFVREGIINAYLASTSVPREQLAAQLRKKYTVEILDPEVAGLD